MFLHSFFYLMKLKLMKNKSNIVATRNKHRLLCAADRIWMTIWYSYKAAEGFKTLSKHFQFPMTEMLRKAV